MTKWKAVIVFILLGLVAQSQAQVTQFGDFNARMNTIVDGLPGDSGDDFFNPDSVEYQDWKQVITTLLTENYSTAETQANALDYDLIKLIDSPDTFYILERQMAGPYWGTYAYNPNGCRDVVVQSPHPKKDTNTGKQGAYVFSNSKAKFYCLKGTNRCNHATFSTCSGTSSICTGSSEPYRISDVAHNDSSAFQATTEAVHESNDDLIFLQLHGFAKQPTDPYVILSNGTQITPSPDWIDSLAQALVATDDTLDYKIAHQDLAWTRLRGFTNTQARYLNDEINVCGSNSDTTYGHFIHCEQEKSRLRDDSTKWEVMNQAVQMAFPCAGETPVDPPDPSSIEKAQASKVNLAPNPFNHSLRINGTEGQDYTLKLFNVQGQVVFETTTSQQTIELPQLRRGICLYQVMLNHRVYRGTLVRE